MTFDAHAAETMQVIDREYQLVSRSPAEGLRAVGNRLLASPGHYAGWYLHKPLELWGWDIGIGQGDIYVFATRHSLLAINPVLRTTTGVFFIAWPLILLAALVGVIVTLARGMRWQPSLCAAACLAVYATPLRGIEVLLAAVAVSAALEALSARRAKLNQSVETAA
jgi:hypothetical protein